MVRMHTQEPYRHILIATDFSEPAERAVKIGADLAQRFAARVTLLHAYDAVLFERVVAPLSIGREELERQMADTARAELERIARDHLADAEGVDCTTVAGDSPPRAIVEHAAQHGVDLCVLGTHGRSGLSRMLAGSVAESVVRNASCDVLTIRATPKSWPPSKILAATDFSDASQPAVARAVGLGEALSTTVSLAHVYDDSVPIPTPDGKFERKEHARQRLLEDTRRATETYTPAPSPVLLTGGNFARELCEHAERDGADLIVVGTHGRTGVAQVLIGSVAERVVRRAPAAALIVRSQQPDA